jgi:hypothetical protein
MASYMSGLLNQGWDFRIPPVAPPAEPGAAPASPSAAASPPAPAPQPATPAAAYTAACNGAPASAVAPASSPPGGCMPLPQALPEPQSAAPLPQSDLAAVPALGGPLVRSAFADAPRNASAASSPTASTQGNAPPGAEALAAAAEGASRAAEAAGGADERPVPVLRGSSSTPELSPRALAAAASARVTELALASAQPGSQAAGGGAAHAPSAGGAGGSSAAARRGTSVGLHVRFADDVQAIKGQDRLGGGVDAALLPAGGSGGVVRKGRFQVRKQEPKAPKVACSSAPRRSSKVL